MTFATDTVEALESAVFLSNSELEPDTLTTLVDLERYFTGFGYTGPMPTEADLEPVRATRAPLRELFLASRDEAVPIVNGILHAQVGKSTMSWGFTKLATRRNGRSAETSPARRRA